MIGAGAATHTVRGCSVSERSMSIWLDLIGRMHLIRVVWREGRWLKGQLPDEGLIRQWERRRAGLRPVAALKSQFMGVEGVIDGIIGRKRRHRRQAESLWHRGPPSQLHCGRSSWYAKYG